MNLVIFVLLITNVCAILVFLYSDSLAILLVRSGCEFPSQSFIVLLAADFLRL